MPIYLDTSHTARTNARTGIQTVVRGLLAALLAHGQEAIPVRWSFRRRALTLLKPSWQANLQHPILAPTWLPRGSLMYPRCWWAWIRGCGLSYRTPLHLHPNHANATQGEWILLPELMEGHHVHAVADYARARGMRIATIFHDAIAWLHPSIVRHWTRQQHQDYMRALTSLDRIIAVSHESARHFREIAASLQWPCPPISVCTLPAQVAGQDRCTSLPRTTTSDLKILCVSTLEPRKNHARILNAFRSAQSRSQRKMELHLVGASYDAAPEMAHMMRKLCRENSNIFWHSQASAEDLRGFYRACDFTIFGSWIEGFGMPVMESLWFGKPCLCANESVMAENAAGGGCLTADMQDTDAIAEAILRLTDDTLRHRLAAEAVQRELKTWHQFGGEILNCLRDH